MANTAADLARLRAEMGEDAYLLNYVPLDKVHTAPLDDHDAVSFKMLFGFLTESATGTQRYVWIYLYPALKKGSYPALQFHSHDIYDGYHAKYDSETISKNVMGFNAAFSHHGKRSSKKMLALAKYYFLEKLQDIQTESDIEMLKGVGVPITKSFREDLKAACRDFQVEARDGDQRNSQDSEETMNFFKNTPEPEVRVSRTPLPMRLSSRKSFSDSHFTYTGTVDALVQLNNEEEKLNKDIATTQEKLAALDAARKNLEEEHEGLLRVYREKVTQEKDLKTRQRDLVHGLTAEDAFKIGRELGRSSSTKRRRFE